MPLIARQITEEKQKSLQVFPAHVFHTGVSSLLPHSSQKRTTFLIYKNSNMDLDNPKYVSFLIITTKKKKFKLLIYASHFKTAH